VVVVHVVVVVVVAAVDVSVRTGRIGEFDSDGFAGAVRDKTIELLDGTFRFVTLIKPHEPDALRQT